MLEPGFRQHRVRACVCVCVCVLARVGMEAGATTARQPAPTAVGQGPPFLGGSPQARCEGWAGPDEAAVTASLRSGVTLVVETEYLTTTLEDRLEEGMATQPLQYSCLGNPMDRGAWRATVHGVAKGWTRLIAKPTSDTGNKDSFYNGHPRSRGVETGVWDHGMPRRISSSRFLALLPCCCCSVTRALCDPIEVLSCWLFILNSVF